MKFMQKIMSTFTEHTQNSGKKCSLTADVKLHLEVDEKKIAYQFPFWNDSSCAVHGSSSSIVIRLRLLFLSRKLLFAIVMYAVADAVLLFIASVISLERWWWWWCLRRCFWCSSRAAADFLCDWLFTESTAAPNSFLLVDFPLLTVILVLVFASLVLNIRLIRCTSSDWFTCASFGCNRKFWTLKNQYDKDRKWI